MVNGKSTKGNDDQNLLFSKVFPFVDPWIMKIILGGIVWYLSQIHGEFKAMQSDLQNLKTDVREVKTSVDFLRTYDLTKK